VNPPALKLKFFVMKFGNIFSDAPVVARAQSRPVRVHYLPWSQTIYCLAADKMPPYSAEPGLQRMPRPA
jgi:hypothetical protein